MKTNLTILALLLAFNLTDASATDARASGIVATAEATKTLLTHHLSSFQDNDLEAVVSDYTDESVLITAAATFTGREAIRGFFAKLMPQFPKQETRFELDKMIVNGELVFIVWHATTPTLKVPLGSDTFVIKDGKILRQTFVGQMLRTSDSR
jgi:predicted SnoaL-like aldol condensation-catalyzing enzyme